MAETVVVALVGGIVGGTKGVVGENLGKAK